MPIRLAVLAHHYRHGWDWDDEVMPAAAERLARWQAGQQRRRRAPCSTTVRDALDDDLDTPAAVAAVDDAAESGVDVSGAAALLGLDLNAAR